MITLTSLPVLFAGVFTLLMIVLLAGFIIGLNVVDAVPLGRIPSAMIIPTSVAVSFAILFLLAWLPAMVVSLVWIYRSACNAHALSRARVHPTPGWSVGWYFVPLANLFKPYSAMKEIWAASSNPQDWKRLPTPTILQLWWFFWVTGAILGRVSFKMSMKAEDVGSLLQANLVGLVDSLWSLPLLVVFGVMVQRLTAMQLAATPASESDEPFIDTAEMLGESNA